jgi:ubiquinone/menaquinone biosynthesis C-methylase UbiE
MDGNGDRYTHGHHESVLRSHQWRTAANSAGFLIPLLRSGQKLLDVGCGPGTITSELAELVAPGLSVGIDLSAEVIEVARGAAKPAQVNLTFQVGDVYDLAFGDGSLDVLYAHQVLQHLSRPVAALGEMRRVLRSGGVLAVRDADYGAFLWAPQDPRLERWMELYHEITRANGAEADAGRHLASWVREAGFEQMDVTSSNWTFHTRAQRAWWGQLWADRVRHSEFARQGLEYAFTTRAELEEIAGAFEAWAGDEGGVFVVVNVEVVARR